MAISKSKLYLRLNKQIAVCGPTFEAKAQTQYKVITSIESIVPGGIGRSRMIESTSNVDYTKNTTERTNGKDGKQGNVSRRKTKIDDFKETKMLNFYSTVGVNFQNIASNYVLITSMLNRMTADG